MPHRENIKQRLSESRAKRVWTLPSVSCFDRRSNFVKRQQIIILLLGAMAVLITACMGSGGGNSKTSQPTDTVYTQEAAMAVYDYQPQRALQIIDSAVIVGNLSEVWADVNRARIYSQSQMTEQLDSLLSGQTEGNASEWYQEGVRLDTARAIAERLMLHDSVKASPALRQNVLEILIYTARRQQDSVRWLQRSRELVDVCRQQGAETEALRTEAELVASLYYTGRKEQSLARLDSVTAALSSLEPFRFNELDALIIASKRKIGVLNSTGHYAEVLPVARRIIELLDDYEQHPDRYHDGTYREPADSAERNDYIRFYRSQAQNLITSAYAALGNRGSMEETLYEVERTVRDATAREHVARYNALQQQMQRREAEARADRIRLQAIGIFVIALLAIAFAIVVYRKNRDIRQKNRVLAQQLTELYDNTRPAAAEEATGSEASGCEEPEEWSAEETYRHIRDEVIRLQLYTDPGFGRQSVIERFHLTKDRASRVFSQGSEHNSISDFITECRLDHARRLLVSRPDMSIADIAAASGFGVRTTFTRSFKAKHGLTPTEFREQQG